ncbi:hypothetical protein GGD50_006342 [Rhizobium paranaense]|uniref:Uncharacterized protein n=1 Tax=Rhizobium paranaense TaxID=1650438 RepID=A0A7W8XY44_9HYPH|nr:hypothetical protein [Rhizobium paranaense]
MGISLLSACTFRLRRRICSKWDRGSTVAALGSAYVLSVPRHLGDRIVTGDQRVPGRCGKVQCDHRKDDA